jgi:hypothetical protein
VDGETEKATTITYGRNEDITLTGLDLYQNTVRLDYASSTDVIDFSNTDFYDFDQDTDVLFDSDSGSTTIGFVGTGSDLTIATGTTLVAPAQLDVYGSVTQAGVYTASGGTVSLEAAGSTLTGDFVGGNALHDVSIQGARTVFAGAVNITGALTISAEASLTTEFDMDIAGDVTSIGDFFAASSSVTIGGNITASSTFDNRTGSLVLDGTSAQSVQLLSATTTATTTVLNNDFETATFPPAGWSTGGNSNWARTTSVTSGGSLGAAVSGPVPETGGESWFETTDAHGDQYTIV